jgi:hypothetical protein
VPPCSAEFSRLLGWMVTRVNESPSAGDERNNERLATSAVQMLDSAVTALKVIPLHPFFF